MKKPKFKKPDLWTVPCPEGKKGCLVLHQKEFMSIENARYNEGLKDGLCYLESVLKELPGRVEIYSIIKNIQIREMQKGLKVNQYILDEIYEAVNKRIQEAIKEK